MKIGISHVALVLCSASCITVASSISSLRSGQRDMQRRYDLLLSVSTNLVPLVVRVHTLEGRFSDLSSSVPIVASSSDFSPSTSGPESLKQVGDIPYYYFRAQGYRGITNGDIRAVVGQRTRYGVLTDCGRDFAEFDGTRVYGLSRPEGGS